MKAGLLSNRDVLAGLLFIAIGAGSLAVSSSYAFGTVQQMGPGFFPRVLGVIIAGLGAMTLAKGLRSGEAVEGSWGWAPLAILTVALVAFGWLMERVGMLPSVAVLTLVGARAGQEFRWGEALVLTVVMMALTWAIFVAGLGLPYPLVAFEFGR